MQIGSTSSNPKPIPQIPLFIVEASRTGYWRQAAYATYTGSAWKSNATVRPYEGTIPNDDRTVDGRETAYSITLLQSSPSLPTRWQPESVSVQNGSTQLQVTSVGGIQSRQPIPKGTTYVARSAAPPRDPERLREAGTDYPDALYRRYTQLPPETPDRVAAFTADLTADADTPYETAITVRNWLRTSKTYSLNASHEAGEPIADQFIFEMEKGYCQYFATTMVAMLRTQGIPARYVVGYSGGEQIGPNRYLVTSDTGHAWVEVYFPDVGWIRFDPTAAGELPVQNPQPPYNISLNRSAVAGATVSISVQKNASPVIGAPVYVNGERIGWTGSDGSVTTQLPYVADITITARPPGAGSKYSEGTSAATTIDPPQPGGFPRTMQSARRYNVVPPDVTLHQQTEPDCSTANGTAVTCRSATNVTINITGDPVQGTTILISASIRDVPIRNGSVLLDGTQVGTTNESGAFTLSLQGVATGTHEIRVTRQAVSETVTITVTEPETGTPTATPTPTPRPDEPKSLNISVSPQFVIPLPMAKATVNVTRMGQPVPNATVTMAGSAVGQTGLNGTLTLTLPLQRSISIAATGTQGTSAKTTITGLYRNGAAVLGGAIVLIGAALIYLRRRGVTPRTIAARLHAALEQLTTVVVEALVKLTTGIIHAGRTLRRLAHRLGQFIVALPGLLSARGLAVLALLDPRRLLRLLIGWAKSLVSSTEREHTTLGDNEPSRTHSSTEDAPGAPPTLRELWTEFASLVSPPRLRTKTPGEIASYAVDRGLPAAPVEALTEIYRDAEYGRTPADESRLEKARGALQSIRESIGGEN